MKPQSRDLPDRYFKVEIGRQTIALLESGRTVGQWPVSTARNGAGERRGSEKTPRGWHAIRALIGGGLPQGTVFRGRRPTGEIFDEALEAGFPGRDWILTRILWLGGLEPGLNRYGPVDTAWRYIYIHGSPDRGVRGIPESHGCIRMKSKDVIDVFQRAAPGMRVLIEE